MTFKFFQKKSVVDEACTEHSDCEARLYCSAASETCRPLIDDDGKNTCVNENDSISKNCPCFDHSHCQHLDYWPSGVYCLADTSTCYPLEVHGENSCTTQGDGVGGIDKCPELIKNDVMTQTLGQRYESGERAPFEIGIHDIELEPSRGAQFLRAAGTFGTLVEKIQDSDQDDVPVVHHKFSDREVAAVPGRPPRVVQRSGRIMIIRPYQSTPSSSQDESDVQRRNIERDRVPDKAFLSSRTKGSPCATHSDCSGTDKYCSRESETCQPLFANGNNVCLKYDDSIIRGPSRGNCPCYVHSHCRDHVTHEWYKSDYARGSYCIYGSGDPKEGPGVCEWLDGASGQNLCKTFKKGRSSRTPVGDEPCPDLLPL